MSANKEFHSAKGLIKLITKITTLTKSQREAVDQYDENKFSSDKEDQSSQDVINIYIKVFEEMNIGTHPDVGDWVFNIQFKGKAVIDSGLLFNTLRLLPDTDIQKIRLFNRFIGQQLFKTTSSDMLHYQEKKQDKLSNRFFDNMHRRTQTFASLFGDKIDALSWPEKELSGTEREQFHKKLDQWRNKFITLPGIRYCANYFSESNNHVFNAFFHTQRQFDSDDWKDYDEEKKPNPQPLPRIVSYRATLNEMNTEFSNTESSVGMCFDYCRMRVEKVIPFIREAEDAFLKLVNHLDDDYPVEIDFAHKELHFRATKIKQMMFPLRCLFYEELDTLRSANDSNDNTLDSYLDMTLGKENTFIPQDYLHFFDSDDLDSEIKEIFLQMLDNNPKHPEVIDPEKQKLSSHLLIIFIQQFSLEKSEELAEKLGAISMQYEETYKSDENNISRRMARMLYLYMAALSKKEVMRKASEERLNNIKNIADRFTGTAEKFSEVDIENENAIRDIKDDQLPMMASPEQMEDFYNTQKVVQRLADGNSEFEETARQIEQGLQAAMQMMRRAEEFMERMIKRMFVNPEDSKDLLDSVHELVGLSYKTQQTLADLAKKEATPPKFMTPKIESEIEKMKNDIEEYKSTTGTLQSHLKEVLAQKRELITKMRITQDEKDAYKNQLRLITMMTINSMQAQKSSAEAAAET